MSQYIPNPIDTHDVVLPPELIALGEKIAENVHEAWAAGRYAQGWRYGKERDDQRRLTPCMAPYDQLSEEEKDYDRTTAMATLRLVCKLGFEIRKAVD